jgi:protein disulfide-isomerase A1
MCVTLTDDNFDSVALAPATGALVEFYAPWCGHCKQLAPEYAKAAQQLADEPVKLAMVDATEQKAVAERFGIKGFPSLKFFNTGKPSEYSGGRTAPDIVSFMKKKSGPAAATLTTTDELTNTQESNDAFVVGYFADVESAAAKAFVSAASQDEDNVYTITSSAEIKAELGLTADTVVVLKAFDEGRNDVAAPTDADAITSFVGANVIPLINTYTRDKAKKIFGSPVKIHALFVTDGEAAHHETTVEQFKTVAGDHKGEVLFVNIPSTEKSILDYFGLEESHLPAFVLADMSAQGMKKFPFTGDINSGAVSEFINSFKAGTLKPTLKSEEPEASDTTGPVTILKGTSFKELVLDNTKDVLVEFYAPWCGHCKKLTPIYDELGEKYADNENIVIAKMDSTANEIDVDGVNVSGFPTLFFFKGDDKANPVPYKGGRDFESFVSYLEENTHNPATSADEL